jgi:ubiquitin C
MFVSEVKTMIERIDQIPCDQQRLVYNGKQLEDDRALDYYDVKEDTVIHIILRIRGGMFHETSARKDFGLVQCAWLTHSMTTIESIEELEERIKLLKSRS